MTENMGDLISGKVAALMTPAFVEEQVQKRVEKLVVDAVDQALRSYSDTGKLINEAVANSLRVNRLDLPAYGETVAKMLRQQIDSRVSELIAGRLAADMDELLRLAPKEVKLSEIAEEMLDTGTHAVDYGPAITVIVEQSDVVSSITHLYLDDVEHYAHRDKYKCRYRLTLSDGVAASASVDDRDVKKSPKIGPAWGIEQKLRAYVACGTKVILDEEHVVIGRGDY